MFLLKLLVIAAMTLALSTAALARCSTHTIVSTSGTMVCTTCCSYGNCTTTCL